jgi:hypothetical protein
MLKRPHLNKSDGCGDECLSFQQYRKGKKRVVVQANPGINATPYQKKNYSKKG